MEYNKPENLKLSENVAKNFKLCKGEVIVFFEATKTIEKSQKTQVAQLLNLQKGHGTK